MAGIYIHIPFCRKACSYCNFHFSTNLKRLDELTEAIIGELLLQRHFFEKATRLASVYWGGGTPSVLRPEQINRIWEVLQNHFEMGTEVEVTLEANPDDLSPTYVKALRQTPINRLSIGVQSWRDADLTLMNRSHSAAQAHAAVQTAQDHGFNNLTLDLIYGLNDMGEEEWLQQLQTTADYHIPHFSAYALTVEPRTALAHQITSGRQKAPSEETAAEHFGLLQTFAERQNYRHYEISNLARPGHEAVHNSNYWKQKPYLGLGPSAHSYKPHQRFWNLAHNRRYSQAITQGRLPQEGEQLSEQDRYHEWLMTGLRLAEGLALEELEQYSSGIREHFEKECKPLLQSGKLIRKGKRLSISPHQRFYADGLAASLFRV